MMDVGSSILFAILAIILYWLYNERNSGGKIIHGQKRGSVASFSVTETRTDQTRIQENVEQIVQPVAKHADVICDHFSTIEDVTEAMRKAGLDQCNVVFGIDFTASNVHQGLKTFRGRSLHYLDKDLQNPYQQVISILGETLEPFDDDGLIPAYGFGDKSTTDRAVFSLTNEGHCKGFHGVLEAYNEKIPNVVLSGPTSFAPLIHQVIQLVQVKREYHILVIVADGQETDQATREAIVEASNSPLSIILIGVGDGPWDTMEEFDDSLPTRKFDNFQFVDYHEVISNEQNPRTAFALRALMEIPDQYNKIKQLGLLSP
ncbi:hypothetical protein ACJMK2_007232 [Sinanodonta woodiana]|uniref:VWFA domain-containing protein n=1 Tax=Sinanodonta woodiana TaxID=1069815 RepID=A0ABD3VHW5_SINWO